MCGKRKNYKVKMSCLLRIYVFFFIFYIFFISFVIKKKKIDNIRIWWNVCFYWKRNTWSWCRRIYSDIVYEMPFGYWKKNCSKLRQNYKKSELASWWAIEKFTSSRSSNETSASWNRQLSKRCSTTFIKTVLFRWLDQ